MPYTPNKLSKGDLIRVISPSTSLNIISSEVREIANGRFKELGLNINFGKHGEEINEFESSSIESRVDDLMTAFKDKSVKCVMTSIGGFNSNQLLRYLDYDVIKNNPKIFIGYSDITALNNAIYAKTGIVTYSGPCYSTFGHKKYFEYTLDYFKKCLMSDKPYDIVPSESWSDDKWYIDQDNITLIDNPGWLVINEGEAEGRVIGENLCTLNLLQGTEYFPSLIDSLLFLEDDENTNPKLFDRDLQSTIHLPEFNKVKGLVIGRFQKESNVTNDNIISIIKSKKELNNIPVIANVDFGHTDPRVSLPIGGVAHLSIRKEGVKLEIIKH